MTGMPRSKNAMQASSSSSRQRDNSKTFQAGPSKLNRPKSCKQQLCKVQAERLWERERFDDRMFRLRKKHGSLPEEVRIEARMEAKMHAEQGLTRELRGVR